MVARLLRREQPGVHLLLHVRMILGELLQRAVAQQIDPRVPDLANEIPIVGEHQHACGRSHPTLVGLGQHTLVDAAIRLMERELYAIRRLGFEHRRQPQEVPRDDLYRHLARDFPGGVSSHAVGDDKHTTASVSLSEEIVFVARPNHPDIGTRAHGELQGHRTTETTSAAATPPVRSGAASKLRGWPCAIGGMVFVETTPRCRRGQP